MIILSKDKKIEVNKKKKNKDEFRSPVREKGGWISVYRSNLIFYNNKIRLIKNNLQMPNK